MEINKVLLLRLRKETLAPFSACAEALSATNNNYEEAKKSLFSKSILKAKTNISDSKDMLPEGKILALNSEDYSISLMFILRAQTDFVTNSEGFQTLQKRIGEILLNYLSKSDSKTIPQIEEILQMKDNQDNLTIENKILSLSSITKERIQLSEIWISPRNSSYITLSYKHHNFKLGALLTLKKENEILSLDFHELKKLVLHYAATDSEFLSEDQVTTEWLDRERSKLRESLLSKNPNVKNLENIVEKQIKKIVNDLTFSSQSFILDSSIKISDILFKYKLKPFWSVKATI